MDSRRSETMRAILMMTMMMAIWRFWYSQMSCDDETNNVVDVDDLPATLDVQDPPHVDLVGRWTSSCKSKSAKT